MIQEKHMPLYEFECLDCGKGFEQLILKASQASDVVCPVCKSRRIEERFSTFASSSSSKTSAAGQANCAPSGG
jgi:putative FmdB family regulatory protein